MRNPRQIFEDWVKSIVDAMLDWFDAFFAPTKGPVTSIKEYYDGYDWALERLNSGDMTPFDLQVQYTKPIATDTTDFDRGVRRCTDIYCLRNPFSDNRI